MKIQLALLYLFFLCGTAFSVVAQENKVGSLKKLLHSAKENNDKIDLLFKLGAAYEDAEPNEASKYFKTAFALSKKLNNDAGKLKYYRKYSNILFLNGKTDSVKILGFEALKQSQKMKDSLEIANSLIFMGKIMIRTNEYEEASDYLNKGRLIFSKLEKPKDEAIVLNILQLLSYFMHNYKQATEYGKESIDKAKSVNDSETLCMAYNNITISYIALDDYQNAKNYLELSNNLAKKNNNKLIQALYFLNHADIDYHQSNFSELKPDLDKAKKILVTLGENDYIALLNWGYSIYYLYNKDYQLAEKFANSSLAIAKKVKNKDTELKALTTLSHIKFAQRETDSGYQFAKKAQKLSDSILNESITRKSAYYEKHFESQKKDSQIKLQQSQIKQKNILNYILVGSALALGLILFLSYRNYNHRKKLQQQRITELETEKQLLATQSLLKGQEDERSRLAKDLHDGLGGLLSGIKLQLGAMKGNLILTEEHAVTFDRALLKLDESISEMRRVSHNMMPESLMKSGLKQAILDYCESLSYHQKFSINCELHGIDGKLKGSTEVILYRIIQELINNALKHSEATQILVQIFRDENQSISVTVEDNGKGFDISNINFLNSSGIRNLKSRVEYLKGTMDVKSEMGKGTSVFIECKEDDHG